MSWWVIVNPAAGRNGDLTLRAQRALDRYGIEASIEESESAAHISELVDDGWSAGRRRFMVVGGDGATSFVVDALMRLRGDERPTLAILPAGTGSDFVRTFALPRNLEDAAARIADGESYPVDVGKLEWPGGDRYFLNVADVGIAAATIPTAARLPNRLGSVKYVAAFWLTLPGFKRTEIDLRVGSRRFTGEALNVVIANGQFFGGGINVAPKAMLTDGAFDIQVFAVPKRRAIDLMPRVMRGTHLGHRGIRRFVGAEFSLETADPWPIEADGEAVGTTPVSGCVVPAAITLTI